MPRLRLAMAQTNPTVGDIAGNAQGLLEMAKKAHAAGAQVFLTGELALTGYPIEDLALRDNFLTLAGDSARSFARMLDEAGMGDMLVVLGHPEAFDSPGPRSALQPPARARNCASIILQGAIHASYAKHHLPNYAVFDEFRTFVPGNQSLIVRAGGVDLGVVICEDLWRSDGPVATLSDYPLGALLVPNASPFERDKDAVRRPLVTTRAKDMDTTVAYVNLVGGQDDLVFDGDSMVVDPQGTLLAQGARFVEDLILVDLEIPDAIPDAPIPPGAQRIELSPLRSIPAGALGTVQPEVLEPLEVVWRALVTGVRDYTDKNGFPSVILGLSGGIDSAVCASIAADALGPDRVVGVSLPSVHSSQHSRDDAQALAEALGIRYRVEPIADVVAPVDRQLGLTGLAAENVQARMRAVILMGISNMEGHLVLTTGNKSELAVGYSTIYGDSVGGFAPIKDVPKTMVWDLARWRNDHARRLGHTPPIPESSITKAPSAELRPDQTDQDSLPDYALLDEILELLIVHALDGPQIIERGFDPDTVERIISLVSRAEWKRRQGAIGPRISSVAFGRDRRLPVTSRMTSLEGQG